MAADRDYETFTCKGVYFIWNLYAFLDSAPMSDYWTILPGQQYESTYFGLRRSRIIVKHNETEEYFNLVQIANNYQEILVIHNCGDTIINLDRAQCITEGRLNDFWDLQYNVPSSAVQLTYPEGTTPSGYLSTTTFTVIGTSQFIFIGSEFEKDSLAFSSTGIFGFLDSYDDTSYKIVGGLPTDNFTCYPLDLENHFWESGYQNFGIKFVEGSTFLLTTFQVHDLSDLANSFTDIKLFPLIYFEESTAEYSGRIAGELYDCWRIANPGGGYEIRDRLYLGDVTGTSKMAMVFKDGEDLSTAIAVRYQ